jgi:IclR family acetate operon transcriptional repressor
VNRSLAKALATVEALAANPKGLTALDLGRALKLPRATVYRILGTLGAHGYVERANGNQAYRLSLKVLDLGSRVLQGVDLLEAAQPVLQDLQRRCRETVHLAVCETGRMVYLHKLEGDGPFVMKSRVGASMPMHSTALGKSVLAFLPAAQVNAILQQHGLPRRTPRTIVSRAALERELARVRRQGYAIDDIENEEGVRCAGAPVLDHRGLPAAAISISAPASRMSRARARGLAGLVREQARRLSAILGWAGGNTTSAGEMRPNTLPPPLLRPSTNLPSWSH